MIKSNAGNAEVSLNVDLGKVRPADVQNQHHRSHDGPSRQRCRLRRAQARTASKADEALEIIEDDGEPAAEVSRAKESETVVVQTEPETLKDGFCSDKPLKMRLLLVPLKKRVMRCGLIRSW